MATCVYVCLNAWVFVCTYITSTIVCVFLCVTFFHLAIVDKKYCVGKYLHMFVRMSINFDDCVVCCVYIPLHSTLRPDCQHFPDFLLLLIVLIADNLLLAEDLPSMMMMNISNNELVDINGTDYSMFVELIYSCNQIFL